MARLPDTVQIAAPDGTMSVAVALPEADSEANSGANSGGPAASAAPGVLVLMEAYGVNDHIRSVVARLAAQGYVAMAPDLYYRERTRSVGYDETDRAVGLVMRTIALSRSPEELAKDERVMADIEVALRALRAHPRVAINRVGVLGFCMGGRLAFLTACRVGRDVRAGVVFYGGRMVPIVEEARGLEAPLLFHFGADDTSIKPPEIDRIQAELSYREKLHEVVVHPEAEHGFFCEDRASFQPKAAERAWTSTLDWFGKHLS